MSDHRREEIDARITEAVLAGTLEPSVYDGDSAYRTRHARVHHRANGRLLLDRKPATEHEVREALQVPASACLYCDLGIPDFHAAGRAAREWREGPR